MKTFKNILKDITTNEQAIITKTQEADALMLTNEIAHANSISEIREIKNNRSEADEATATELYKEADNLRIENSILFESAKASFAVYASQVIGEVLKKYEGKKLGEKTKEKIYNEVRAQGVGFYFDRYYIDGTKCDTLKVWALNKDGYKLNVKMGAWYSYLEIELTAINEEGKRAWIIDENNTVCILPIFQNYNKYAINAKKRVEEVRKAYNKLSKAHAEALKAQKALNDLLPYNGKHVESVSYTITSFCNLF